MVLYRVSVKRKDKRKTAVIAEFQVRIESLYLIKTDPKVNCTREFTPGSSIVLYKMIFNVEKLREHKEEDMEEKPLPGFW